MAETTTSIINNNNNPLLPPNPTKFYTHFLYKAIFLSIFLLLLPLFPSEAPNFINQTINTTSWELLQLLFVGIAVSYGLFSKRTNDETDTEKHDNNAHSYVAKFLQVSSVFDDDSSETTPSPLKNNNSNYNSKIQTWNSQYYRGEPIVVVANETTSDSDRVADSVRVSDSGRVSGLSSIMLARSNSRRRFEQSEGKPEENIVFRSPIPWRSRSGRMEVKENGESQTLEEDSSEINNPIQSRSFRYQSSKPVSEIQSKKISSFSPIPTPPPPPPPPPPPHQPVKVNYSHTRFRRSLTNEELENRRRRDFAIRSRSDASESFRIPKEKEYDEYLSHDKEIESFLERRGSQKKMIEEKKELISEESEEDDELVELASKSNEKMVDYSDINGPDVDKKADEFIAKFREQIRLQRIASIRRSTTIQTPNKNGIK